MTALESLLEPVTRGDPESPLRWTCKSTRRLAAELTRQEHPVGPRTVAALLRRAGYSLQADRKTREGASHPDRDAQFEYINASVARLVARGQPAISVDTKKEELVGDFRNGGREWHPQGEPEEVRVHDFLDKALGKAIPYGVYDMVINQGWVSVGIRAYAPILHWKCWSCNIFPLARGGESRWGCCETSHRCRRWTRPWTPMRRDLSMV